MQQAAFRIDQVPSQAKDLAESRASEEQQANGSNRVRADHGPPVLWSMLRLAAGFSPANADRLRFDQGDAKALEFLGIEVTLPPLFSKSLNLSGRVVSLGHLPVRAGEPV